MYEGVVMSLNASHAWRTMQQKQKRCDRCKLFYPETLNKCDHCSDLNNSQLVYLKFQHIKAQRDNSAFGKSFLFCALIVGLLLLLSFL